MIDYRVPTMLDSPDIQTQIVESIDPNGPFGAKEASEGGMGGFIPAFTQAIAEATGVEFNVTPLTPDRIVEGLKKSHRLAALRSQPRHDASGELAE